MDTGKLPRITSSGQALDSYTIIHNTKTNTKVLVCSGGSDKNIDRVPFFSSTDSYEVHANY